MIAISTSRCHALNHTCWPSPICGDRHSYNRYSDALEECKSNAKMRVSYECAARARDEDLLKARNVFGNVNVKGAPFYCADDAPNRNLFAGANNCRNLLR
jgi:hypothetical protein